MDELSSSKAVKEFNYLKGHRGCYIRALGGKMLSGLVKNCSRVIWSLFCSDLKPPCFCYTATRRDRVLVFKVCSNSSSTFFKLPYQPISIEPINKVFYLVKPGVRNVNINFHSFWAKMVTLFLTLNIKWIGKLLAWHFLVESLEHLVLTLWGLERRDGSSTALH